MVYLDLILAYFQIGLFSIGGGHASIPVAQSVVVDSFGWLSLEEFTAMITISEMTPGPFGINSATYVGLKVGGVLGGVIATLAFLVPSVTICLSLFLIVKRFRKLRWVDGFMQGIRPAVSGLICSAGLSMFLLAVVGGSVLQSITSDFSFDPIAVVIVAASFAVTHKTKINPVLIILLSGVVGAAIYGFI